MTSMRELLEEAALEYIAQHGDQEVPLIHVTPEFELHAMNELHRTGNTLPTMEPYGMLYEGVELYVDPEFHDITLH